jgi:glycosyltransferase involved in cell wall biosynthesis
MKIGFLMEVGEEIQVPPFNGPANHVRQVFTELCRRGHIVKILFRRDGVLWKSEDLQEFIQVTVSRIDRGILRWVERLVRRIQFELRLPYLGYFESLRFALACRQELADCDVYYERFSWMTYGGLFAARWLKIPWVLEYNGDPLADLEAKGVAPRGIQRWISIRITNWSFAKAHHVVATGEGWRKSCISTWGVPPEKATTIENGTDLVNALARDHLSVFRIDNGKRRSIRLIYLGGFYRWHGIDILLNALAHARDQGVDLQLVLIGSGDGEREAQELAQSLGLGNVAKFMGRLAADEYAPILADADIGVSPYCGWEEYSGLKIFDYKAAGLACIASGKDGQPTSVEDGKTGLIVPPCDVEALTAAIVKLAVDPELRQRMGQAARSDAEHSHSWSNTAEGIENIFKVVIGQ